MQTGSASATLSTKISLFTQMQRKYTFSPGQFGKFPTAQSLLFGRALEIVRKMNETATISDIKRTLQILSLSHVLGGTKADPV